MAEQGFAALMNACRQAAARPLAEAVTAVSAALLPEAGPVQDDVVLMPYTTLMRRIQGTTNLRGIMAQADEAGRMAEYPEQALTSETAIALLGDAGHYPEIGTFRRAVSQWPTEERSFSMKSGMSPRQCRCAS